MESDVNVGLIIIVKYANFKAVATFYKTIVVF